MMEAPKEIKKPLRVDLGDKIVEKNWRELTFAEWKALSNPIGLAAILLLNTMPLVTGKPVRETFPKFMSMNPEELHAHFFEKNENDGWKTVRMVFQSPNAKDHSLQEEFKNPKRFHVEWPKEKMRYVYEIPEEEFMKMLSKKEEKNDVAPKSASPKSAKRQTKNDSSWTTKVYRNEER